MEDFKGKGRVIEINGVKWSWDERIGRPDDEGNTGYIHDYYKCEDAIEAGKWTELEMYRHLAKTDLWFLLYFVLMKDRANHPYLVQCCRDVQFGPRSNTVDLWFRGSLKTTIISVGETIQDILNDPEQRIGIFSYNKGAALKIFRMVKYTLETSKLLKACFPDILYENPEKEAWKWGDETGLIVKRKGIYREPTLSAWGLLDAMPVGDHFTKRVYDDVVTQDNADSVTENEKLKEKFDLSYNLSTFQESDRVRVIGTTYNYFDCYVYIQNKKDEVTGIPLYHVRRKPVTVDGSFNGASVFPPESVLIESRSNRRAFAAQMLLDPTPVGDITLNPDYIKEVDPEQIPKNLWKFMTVDPAGLTKKKDGEGDAWAILCFGVVPERDDIGASDLYILDLLIDQLEGDEAPREVGEMYVRNGKIKKLGVEKVGISTMEVHISNYLLSKGRRVNTENGLLEVLRPGGRSKEGRIESSLEWPLNNGKIHISKAIPLAARERLKMEMRKYPYWKDDGLDALAYAYDLIKGYRFRGKNSYSLPESDKWREDDVDSDLTGWIVC